MLQELRLSTPKDFDFKRTVGSHGWYDLLPFRLDQDSWTLTFCIVEQGPVAVTISDIDGAVRIGYRAEVDSAALAERMTSVVRHILRFDDDLSEFYRLINREADLKWIAKQYAGRMMRSPTVFEDLVKTICTTNCNWSMTKIMTTNLVEKLGAVSKEGTRAFPTPEAMSAMPVEFYRDEIRAGYRSAYLKELAGKIVEGKLDVESWLGSDVPTADLKKEMKKVKGVGNYAAENLLKLLGRYDGLALDSWLRGAFYKKHNNDIVCDDKVIEKHYERFGKWRGLVMWCDMTKNWSS